MSWCVKCKYGSSICKLVKCPMCGGVVIVDRNPMASKKQHHDRHSRDDSAGPKVEKIPSKPKLPPKS